MARHSSSLGALRARPLDICASRTIPSPKLDALADVNFARLYLDALGSTIQLDGTEVSELFPLAANRTLAGFTVYLRGASIDCRAQADNIATLSARLVSVIADCAP